MIDEKDPGKGHRGQRASILGLFRELSLTGWLPETSLRSLDLELEIFSL